MFVGLCFIALSLMLEIKKSTLRLSSDSSQVSQSLDEIGGGVRGRRLRWIIIMGLSGAVIY